MAYILFLFIWTSVRFAVCNELLDLNTTTRPIASVQNTTMHIDDNCVNIISNKSKPLHCLLFINDPDNSEEVSKAECNEYYVMTKEFFETGDLSIGYQVVTSCQETYNSIEHCKEYAPVRMDELNYDPEELKIVCSLYNEAHLLAIQQNVCFKMAINVEKLGRREQSIYTSEFIRGNYVTEVRKLYNSALELKEMIHSYNLSNMLHNTFISNITSNEIKIIVEEGMEFNEELDEYRTLLYYVYGPVDCVLFVLGFVGNAALIFLMIRYKEIRTTQNMLLMNLAIGDIMNLFSNIVTAYIVEIIFENHFTYFSAFTCKILAFFQYTSIALSVYAVVFLSIQRYIFITSPRYMMRNTSVKTVVTLNIIAVWIFAICFCIPPVILTVSDDYGVCFIPQDFDPTMWNLLYIGVLPIGTVTCFYTLTACQIAKSAKSLPGEVQSNENTRRIRNRSAGVLLALTGVFAFGYLPYIIYLYLLHSNYTLPPPYWYEYVLFKLTFLNPVVNPLALYFGSGTFRRHFHICCSTCCKKSAMHKPLHITVQSKETLCT